MESQKFLEKEGLDVEWVKFSDVNQPLRAVALQTIDLAFAAPSAGAMAVIAEGAPVKIVLNTHIAEVYFVSSIPFVTRVSDLAIIAAFSMAVSFLATIIPSMRAARLNPVEALRYE